MAPLVDIIPVSDWNEHLKYDTCIFNPKSMSGWPENAFIPLDQVCEQLRRIIISLDVLLN